MSRKTSLLRQLQGLGLYRMEEDSLAAAELAAYGEALDAFWEQAEGLKKSCFLDEVENPDGFYFERLFHMEETPYPFPNEEARESRKEKIRCMKLRMAVGNTDFHKQAILSQIESYGMTASIVDNLVRKTVTVTVTADSQIMSDYEEKAQRIRELIPVQASVTVNYSAGNQQEGESVNTLE